MTLIDTLSAIVGTAFEAAGFDHSYGAVKPADRPDLAQFQCNGALASAKKAGENPRALAEKICGGLTGHEAFQDVTIAGPGFINFKLSEDFVNDALGALAGDDKVGGWSTPAAEKIVIDYGGPNVAKPLHVGHLRTAIIGESLKRIFRFAGHEVVGDIHLGDWGLQMGQLISEMEIRQPELIYFDEGVDGPYPDQPPIAIADLEEMYPMASAACKADEQRADIARKATKALQEGRPGYRALWRHFVELSIAAMRVDYDDLGVEFDLWKGEADADPYIPEITQDLRERDILVESDGAEIIRVDREGDKKEFPPIIFLNSKGAIGYHATDIATIVDRQREINPDRMLYVVDARQRLHFEQIFRAVGRAGYFDETCLEHLWFGTMNGKDGKPFKTREGGTLKLRSFIDMLEEKAAARMVEGGVADGLSADEAESVKKKVAIAALKFADLSNPRVSDYSFDIDRFIAFEGKTGPYLLYAAVRVKSLLAKAETLGAKPSKAVASTAEEVDLALRLLSFADAVRDACDKRSPHILCDHIYGLAQLFSKFYAACRILDEKDHEIRDSRLALAAITGRQLETALSLLGLEPPERM